MDFGRILRQVGGYPDHRLRYLQELSISLLLNMCGEERGDQYRL